MNHSEQIAKVFIESLIPGAVMHYREDQSTSTHDFDLEWKGELIAAVEVTTSTCKQRKEIEAAIRDQRKGGFFLRTKRCRKDWSVCPLPTANINKIRKELDQYLADIEADNLERFLSSRDSYEYPRRQAYIPRPLY